MIYSTFYMTFYVLPAAACYFIDKMVNLSVRSKSSTKRLEPEEFKAVDKVDSLIYLSACGILGNLYNIF